MQIPCFKQTQTIFLTIGLCALSPAFAAERFAPEALRQNGKITLTPGFTPDGKTIYFAQSECSPIWECPQRLKRSRLTARGWSTPELMSTTSNGRVDYPSVSPDGRYLLFSWATTRSRHANRGVYDDFDLYRLDLTITNANPEPLDEPDINRIRGGKLAKLRYVHNETAPVLTRSGDLYFWTERLDGLGERDIYMAPTNHKGGFLTAKALPEPVNSNGRDSGGWVSENGKTMLLTYADRGGAGGSDLFVSYRNGENWAVPVNLGGAVNSAAEDFGATITPDNQFLVFSSTRAVPGQAQGLMQIWQVALADIPALQPSLLGPQSAGSVSTAACSYRHFGNKARKRSIRMIESCD